MRKILVIGLLLLAVTSASANGGTDRDGDWWTRQTTRHEKLLWIAGFLDGQAFAHTEVDEVFYDFQTNIEHGMKNSNLAIYQGAIHNRFLREFNGVSPDALTDGLDKVYSDYRNRRIAAAEAMLAVMMGISGSSDEAIEKMLEVLRTRAARLHSEQ